MNKDTRKRGRRDKHETNNGEEKGNMKNKKKNRR